MSASSATSPLPLPSPSPLVPQDIQLELERLRAERDALAAELQIERAERLRAEERLRLFEREKLEQMREGAASREKLAAELEEARLRAMRAEARQAALDADLRLSEIAVRRRGWSDTDPDAVAGQVAEPDRETPNPAEEAEPEPTPESVLARRFASPTPSGGTTGSKYSRLNRPGSVPAPERPGRESVVRPLPPPREANGAADASRERLARESSRVERPSVPDDDADISGGGRLRMSEVPKPRWPSQGADPTPALDDRAGLFGDASSPPRSGAPPRTGGAPFGARGATTGATGGAAAGRPSIDRAQLEMRLAAGHIVDTTERFRQFQPVAQVHIKVCDWLAKARTLDEIDALANGEVARSEIVAILTLFFERSFLVFK